MRIGLGNEGLGVQSTASYTVHERIMLLPGLAPEIQLNAC